jgi:hypothetical protein
MKSIKKQNDEEEKKWQCLLSDMFNVFLSLAKEGANGTLPIGSWFFLFSVIIVNYSNYNH